MGVPLWPRGGVKKKTIQLYDKQVGANREIDLRQELIDLLDGTDHDPQRGHWVLLRRMEKTQRCTCWNRQGVGDAKYSIDDRKYDEADENCPICHGEGWIYDDELHLVRRRMIAPPIGLAGQEQETDIGLVNVPYLVYYFKYYVKPTKQDKVIEIQNTSAGEPVRPFVYQEIHDIAVAEPFRDINGRIEYWRAAVKMEVI